ncbi:MAG: cupin domain-containing protein [Dehalococcoidales bacterium]
MEENQEASIIEYAQSKLPTGAPPDGHPGMQGHNFLHDACIETKGKGSIFVSLTLDEIQPGGALEEHYHSDPEVYHHIYYVISGQIKGSVGDIKKTVGGNTLIYCHSNVKHSIANVGKEVAWVLEIAARTHPSDFKTRIMSK